MNWNPVDWAALILTLALAALMVSAIWAEPEDSKNVKEILLAVIAILSMWFFSKRA